MIKDKIVIRDFAQRDIENIISCFARNNWKKSKKILQKYLQEQIVGERVVWVAQADNEIAGYVTLLWKARYEPFRINGIPEIVDLNVLPTFRNQGIGTRLLQAAESLVATKHHKVGIGVGLYGDFDHGYGAAQRLYVKSGYIPDGFGITYKEKNVDFGKRVTINDDLILWFVKELRRK
jgi:GNAT superfamily N-acetyltransferase